MRYFGGWRDQQICDGGVRSVRWFLLFVGVPTTHVLITSAKEGPFLLSVSRLSPKDFQPTWNDDKSHFMSLSDAEQHVDTGRGRTYTAHADVLGQTSDRVTGQRPALCPLWWQLPWRPLGLPPSEEAGERPNVYTCWGGDMFIVSKGPLRLTAHTHIEETTCKDVKSWQNGPQMMDDVKNSDQFHFIKIIISLYLLYINQTNPGTVLMQS